ncbi:MAG: glycosyltransferase [Chloroflexi bacterium]|nr:MAG: glycosyltransferase [Chloroflexota bacterium]
MVQVRPGQRSTVIWRPEPRGRLGVQSPQPLAAQAVARPRVSGKFLFAGDRKLYVRGVTYGTFRADANGDEFPAPELVERDFALMAANGIDTVRTYTPPPRWLMDAAHRHGLRLMVGLAVERDIGYLNDKQGASRIEATLRARLRTCSGHPALLCYAIANEIPSPVVRWLGRRRVERYLERLCGIVRSEDAGALVTYVNYPSTEYLELPFLDLMAFNVYLESPEALDAYVARLQNIAGDRPLIIGELGLDSARHGEATQARVLEWQIRSAFAAGSAGVFVYAWTDQWYRAGEDVEDWDFGLTRRDRSPKPALSATSTAFSDLPFPAELSWPCISVAICSYNGGRTIRECCEGVRRLEYPNFEVIVVDDGSTDDTAAIAREHGFRVISTPNRGLSAARNLALEAATGEIVAYIDDDAYPDPHWLSYLAWAFLRTQHAAIGGPNLPPRGDGWFADCVGNAPGGPVHVLLSDTEAEHVPGCNLAMRKSSLEAIGGFDPRYRVAGDDVDVCWRLQARGWTIGFHPAALVWHHRRSSIRAYWRQQVGYGKAEALLERKWPDKYNTAGHLTWAGRVYGRGLPQPLGWTRGRVYQGIWGTAPFQALYQPRPSTIWSMSLLPEWYLVIGALAVLSALGVMWAPLLRCLPLLFVAALVPLIQAVRSSLRAPFTDAPSGSARLRLRTVTVLLHLLQPAARLRGRLALGLTPWRLRGAPDRVRPWPRRFAIWSEVWQDPVDRLRSLEAAVRSRGFVAQHGGAFDRWDLEVRGGLFGRARVLVSVEEHGRGRQYVRARAWPRGSAAGVTLICVFVALSADALSDESWQAAAALAALGLVLAVRIAVDCAVAMAALVRPLERWSSDAARQLGLLSSDEHETRGG